MRRDILGLAGWLLVCFLAAGIGSVASINADDFYSNLARPPWAPPPWLFGPVWTALYILMAVAAWLIWRTPPSQQRKRALVIFVLQLALNALWTWLFFAWHRGDLAFFEIIVLAAMIATTIALFYRIRPAAARLLVPYLVWVLFATVLSWLIWKANPATL